jgi:peptidoglycan/LPS O-acetylase OafA/YrhL
MINVSQPTKIEFANSLRGIAVLTVLLGHYLIVFNDIKGAYFSFPAMQYSPFPEVQNFISLFPLNQINAGQLAVALFFLVSGFVIPNSVASLSTKQSGRAAFIIGRALRIWPTYAVGLLITVSALWANSHLNNSEMYQPASRILANMTLFRDWMGQTQIDGVVWTLEAEAKFYLFTLLFWGALAKGKLYPLALITATTLSASLLKSDYLNTLGPELGVANFLWPLPFMLFMSVGIVFNYHYRSLISTKKLIITGSLMFAAFVCSAKVQGLYQAVPASYGVALAVFGGLYFFRQEWSGGPIIRFYAKISFSLYACHAALGYTGMAFMIASGLNPWAAVLIQAAISTGLASALHYAIEVPTHNIGKHLGRLWISKRNPTTTRLPTSM